MVKRYLGLKPHQFALIVLGLLLILWKFTEIRNFWKFDSTTIQCGGDTGSSQSFKYGIFGLPLQKGKYNLTSPVDIKMGDASSMDASIRAANKFTFFLTDANDTSIESIATQIINNTKYDVKGRLTLFCNDTKNLQALTANIIGGRISEKTVEFDVKDTQLITSNCGNQTVVDQTLTLEVSTQALTPVSTPKSTPTLSNEAKVGIAVSVGACICIIICITVLIFVLDARQSSNASLPRQRATFY